MEFTSVDPQLTAPPGFDWRWYVRSYTDLAPAGIVDEASAIRHWREHGCREGRRFGPRRPSGFDWLTYVDHFPDETPEREPTAPAGRQRLACPSIDSIFLRAWGDLACWDDAGSDRALQKWDPCVDYADVFLSGLYDEVRRRTAEGEMPWPEECSRCLLLRMHPPGAPEPGDGRIVRLIRVEPSYHCSLDCPGCVPLTIRRQSLEAFQLDPDILDRILADLTARGILVGALDFQGHGEPTLNPRVWEMGLRSRARLPDTWITMTTNAQSRFRPMMVESGLDEIVCSIDGIDQETYGQYRVHGNFELGWRFMNELAEAGALADRQLRVVWKYILFEHNAEPDTLLRAQRMALDAGVSELVFVLTRNGKAPAHIASPANVPRLINGPTISFRFHEPSIDDLEARFVEAKRLMERGDAEAAGHLLESIRLNLDRFFPSGTERPARHTRLAGKIAVAAAPNRR